MQRPFTNLTYTPRWQPSPLWQPEESAIRSTLRIEELQASRAKKEQQQDEHAVGCRVGDDLAEKTSNREALKQTASEAPPPTRGRKRKASEVESPVQPVPSKRAKKARKDIRATRTVSKRPEEKSKKRPAQNARTKTVIKVPQPTVPRPRQKRKGNEPTPSDGSPPVKRAKNASTEGAPASRLVSKKPGKKSDKRPARAEKAKTSSEVPPPTAPTTRQKRKASEPEPETKAPVKRARKAIEHEIPANGPSDQRSEAPSKAGEARTASEAPPPTASTAKQKRKASKMEPPSDRPVPAKKTKKTSGHEVSANGSSTRNSGQPSQTEKVKTAYVDQHPEEDFHHLGKGLWRRGLPPKSSNARTAVRGPGAKKWKQENTGARVKAEKKS